MFEFLKSILAGKPDENRNGATTYAAPQAPTPSAMPAAKSPASYAASYPGTGTAVAAAPAPVTSSANGNGIVQLPLQAVLGCLPAELQTKVRQANAGAATIPISMEQVLAQLPQGSVKITFGELRQAAQQVFSRDTDMDHVSVSLPLNEILVRLNPALLVRRQNQKQVQIPEEIRSPFGSQGDGLIFSVGPGKSPAPAPAPAPMAAPVRATTPAAPAPARPAPGLPTQPKPAPLAPAPRSAPTPPATFQPKPMAPAARVNPMPPAAVPPAAKPPVAKPPIAVPSAPLAPEPIPFRSNLAPTPTPPPAARPAPAAFRGLGAAPVKPSEPVSQQPIAPRASTPQPVIQPVTQPVAQPARPAGDQPSQPSLSVSLIALMESWPEAVRQEIEQQNLMEAKVALPIELVEQSLRRGKVAFPWKMIRSWIRPSPLPAVSAHDNALLDLPLNVIAPLFLNRQKENGASQQKVALDENIPNLFFGFPQPNSPPEAETDEEGTHAVTKPVDTNYYVWDDNSDSARVDETEFKRKSEVSPGTSFVTRCATPNEVVSRAAALEGVAGALIALPDGLMVASKLAPDLNGDTLAAFLPHIFGKVSQCTRELRMGELNNLNFTVGNVPWKIFRVNAIFFAALGRPGHPLPTGQLASLAAELDRKKQ